MTLIERSKSDIYTFISPSANLKDSANGKTILITGAGTGIGKVIYILPKDSYYFNLPMLRFASRRTGLTFFSDRQLPDNLHWLAPKLSSYVAVVWILC